MSQEKLLQNQHYLWKCLQNIFPLHSIEVNTRNTIKNNSGAWLELDLGIQDLNLAFEFQDAYHYITKWYHQQRVSVAQERDKTKRDFLRSQDKTLITIPCWWNGSTKSLEATIFFERPDLAHHGQSLEGAISLNPDLPFFDSIGIPGVGELMLPSFPRPTYSIFRTTVSEENPWWLGEKYDGVRCCWNPKQRIVYSRRGTAFHISRKYMKFFPVQFIEGEFWFGRSSNDALRLLAHTGPDWQYCRIVAFDIPVPQPYYIPFERRYAILISILKPRHPFLILAARILVRSGRLISNFTKMILREGGEGTIVRKCQSLYENGRSSNLVKIKAHGRDIEAIVVDVTDKNALKLKLPSGDFVTITSSNVQMRSYPKKGDIVMLTFDKVTILGLPRDPQLVRIRTDLSWEEVVFNYVRENPKQRVLPGFIARFSSKLSTAKYWEQYQRQIRSFFEDFARKRGLDPLDPESWYPITNRDIKAENGGHSLLIKLGWRTPDILRRVFPEVKFKDGLFAMRSKWPTLEQRREYFVKLARDYGFDPLLADNWYRFKPNALDYEGHSRVLRMYRFSMRRAMVDVFPDVKFDLSKFPSSLKGYWMQHENQRKYFVEYANVLGFDPLVAANWYTCDLSSFDAKSKSIIRLYGNSLPYAIQATFPEIGIDIHKFQTMPNGHWRNLENRKRFFMDFAKAHNFDPLLPTNWLNIRKTHIATFKGGASMLFAINGNVLRALQLAFPHVPFPTHYTRQAGEYWHNRENRRNFFIEFAQQMGFDHNDYSNWYNLRKSDIKERLQGKSGVLAYYGGSLRAALIDLFPGVDASLFLKNK